MDKEKLKNIKSYLEELKTTKMKQTSPSNFLSIESYSCTLKNNKTITREKILKGNNDGSAAIILPITEDKKIILAIEPRVFTKETVDIGLPAGYIEYFENPIDAAKRELLEETGYESDDFIYLGSYYQDQGCSSAYNYYYIARNCKKVRSQKLDKDEFIKYILVTSDELQELFNEGYIKGLNSAYVIEKSKKYIME